MSSISGIQNVNHPRDTTEDSRKTSEAMRKKADDDFASLLKLQIKALNPNPMEKQDPQAIAQIATSFASMMGTNTIVSEIQSIKEDLAVLRNSMLIGKSIKYPSDGTFAINGQSVHFDYSINGDSKVDEAEVLIQDMNGEVVYREHIKTPQTGHATFTWDGSTTAGEKMQTGQFRFNVVATDIKGKKIDVTTYKAGNIEGVVASGDGYTYTVDGRTIDRSKILKMGI